jgi:hypothetical protein
MLKKNNLFTGILAALIFPAIAWGISYLLTNNVVIINRPAIPYLFAIALNLVAIRLIQKKDMDDTARGIMLATFVIMGVIVVTKIYHF